MFTTHFKRTFTIVDINISLVENQIISSLWKRRIGHYFSTGYGQSDLDDCYSFSNTPYLNIGRSSWDITLLIGNISGNENTFFKSDRDVIKVNHHFQCRPTQE